MRARHGPRRGHYAGTPARQAAADLLPQSLLTHAALLSALARLGPGAEVDQMAFVGRLTNAAPEAAADLAAFLDRDSGRAS